MKILQKIAIRVSATEFAARAIEENADLREFKKKPPPRVVFGIFLMGFSYVIGWPAVAALGLAAVYLMEPLVLIVGGPLIYGISHIMFLAGFYFAGADYSIIFLKWAVRKFVEKYSPVNLSN